MARRARGVHRGRDRGGVVRRETNRFTAANRWFDWPQWGLALGSDQRFKPRWWERRAYFAGLRDAARIAEQVRWREMEMEVHQSAGEVRKRAGRAIIKAVHAYMLTVFGLPPDDKSGLE